MKQVKQMTINAYATKNHVQNDSFNDAPPSK